MITWDGTAGRCDVVTALNFFPLTTRESFKDDFKRFFKAARTMLGDRGRAFILGVCCTNTEFLVKGGEHELKPLLEQDNLFRVRVVNILPSVLPRAFEAGGLASAGGHVAFLYCEPVR